MTAVIDQDHKVIDCPHCKGKLNVEIERKPATVKIEEREHLPAMSELEAMMDRKLEKLKAPPIVVPAEKKKPTIKAPAHIKAGKCKNCSKIHPNEDYQGPATGKCDKCSSIFTDRSSGDCPFCKGGEIEKIDEDDRADMELYEDEHEGHDHD